MAFCVASETQTSSRSTVFHVLAPLVLAVFLACNALVPATAVPADPEPVAVEQPDGTDIRLRLKGDESFSWHETSEGYAVVKDPTDGFWKYARPATNRVAFVAIPDARVGKGDPARHGIRRHAMPDPKMLRIYIKERRRALEGAPEELPIPGTATNKTTDVHNERSR